jgi:hypothetical protein
MRSSRASSVVPLVFWLSLLGASVFPACVVLTSVIGALGCGTTEQQYSPDHEYVVTVELCSLGATAYLVTDVRLRTNPFLLDFGRDRRVLSYDGHAKDISVTWISNNQLDIQYVCPQVAHSVDSWGRLRITHTMTDAPNGRPLHCRRS